MRRALRHHEAAPKNPLKTDTGCIWYQAEKFEDNRGSFFVSHQTTKFSEIYRRFNSNTNYVIFLQDNISISKKNVVRGLHAQKIGPQGKLIRVMSGSVLDVVLDVRHGSPTFGHFEVFDISRIEDTLYVPPGMLHGFWATSDCIFSYKCTEEYDAKSDGGMNPLDADFDFPWNFIKDDLIISPKDRALPLFEEYVSN